MFNVNHYKENLRTAFFGQSIQYYSQLDSTNSKACELISEKTKDGTVVITDNQSAGRGRQSNKWFSIPYKSLTFSIILYPNSLPNQINLYSLLAGLAITDCLIEYDIQAQLKWPNDILINGKKVGGILCESKISGEVIKSMVIGIGLNINEERSDFPQELRKSATSLKIESFGEFQIEQILTSVLNHLEIRLDQIDKTQIIIDAWENRCIHLHRTISFKNSNGEYKGIFKGLSLQGQAIINIDNTELKFDSGEIGQIDFNQ